METRTEKFIKKTTNKGDKKIIRRVVMEDEFELSLEEIERMERNANANIERANQLIADMNDKLTECQKLREIFASTEKV